jgi:hypothetical protein
LFNTFGLPTSTTVSIVFELLGAAVGMAIVKIRLLGADFGEMSNYINSGKALAIISGILLSVVIAFTIGAIVQYISRLIFTFRFEKTMRYFGALWGGIAITAITYFILIKGAKGASFMTAENLEWIKSHTLMIILISLIFWSFILQILYWLFKLNILKVIVLTGTFALAMAFAGNDLVNFIGVPLAGFESFKIFMASEGGSPDSFLMSSLAGKVRTPTLYLLIAGLIMVITLWLSRKARSVVKTELNLAAQNAVDERFQSSIFARSIVRSAINISKGFNFIIPGPIRRGIEKRFNQIHFKNYLENNPGVSFDLIRASVNLVVASILISFATSLKLPLSTTYVTFMVAMGTSLADGAWGRESAVYRISGVLTVVGGWFFTAFSAFTVSFIIALILNYTKLYGLIALIPLAIFLVVKTHMLHSKRTKEESKEEEKFRVSSIDSESIYENCSENIISLLETATTTISKSVDSIIKEKRKKLKKDKKTIKGLNKAAKSLKKEVPLTLQKLTEESYDSAHHYIEIIDYLREAMHCATHIVNPGFDHVDNNHAPLTGSQIESLGEVTIELKNYIIEVVHVINSADFSSSEEIIKRSSAINDLITKIRKKHLKIIKKEPGSTRTNMLFMDILNEIKNLVLHVNNIYKAFRDFSANNRSQKLKSL